MSDVATAAERDFRASAEGLGELMVGIRREIHRHPELGLDNPVTRDVILRELEGLDLDVRTGAALTSVTATLTGGRPGPAILLRADTDALPMTEETDWDHRSRVEGAAHMCGHDAHVAMLLGAVRLLADVRDELPGTVRFVFQPGEEGHAGAALMIRDGALAEGVDPAVSAAFALHVSPNVPVGKVAGRPGPILAATDDFRVVVRGRGGHASTPHFANDPIPVACEMVTALQSLVTRGVNAFDPAVLTVAHLEAGTTRNVIPERVMFEGTIRTVSEHTRRTVTAGFERVVRGVAAAHGCDVDISLDAGYPVTVNDAAVTALAADVVHQVAGPGAFFELPSPVMGAEDFSYFLQEVPGAMFFLGVCPDDIANSLEAPSCHSNLMRLNEAALPLGAALHATVAWRWLHTH